MYTTGRSLIVISIVFLIIGPLLCYIFPQWSFQTSTWDRIKADKIPILKKLLIKREIFRDTMLLIVGILLYNEVHIIFPILICLFILFICKFYFDSQIKIHSSHH